MVRPSANSTDRVSSVTSTLWARAVRSSTTKELIPTPQQFPLMLFDQVPDAVDLFATETVGSFEPHGIEPKVCFGVVALDMNMGRFGGVARVEEESIRPDSEHGRHAAYVIATPCRSQRLSTPAPATPDPPAAS